MGLLSETILPNHPRKPAQFARIARTAFFATGAVFTVVMVCGLKTFGTVSESFLLNNYAMKVGLNANSELNYYFCNATRPLFSYPQSTDPYSVEG